MDRIHQEAQFRQRVLQYERNHGTQETADRYHMSRKTLWKWRKRYDGTLDSLKDRSSRPKTSPRGHSPKQMEQVKKKLKKHKWTDLIRAWQELREQGYPYSYGAFKRVAARLKSEKPRKRVKRKNKQYQRAEYPGQKVQVDVKYVPKECVGDGGKYYQFTAKDECTRWTYRQMYAEHSSHSAREFLDELIENAPFQIRKIQTDNGTEFTKRLLTDDPTDLTLFEAGLAEYGIEYQRIRVATPRHNGKVERQHRTDGMRFYDWLYMHSLSEGRELLSLYQDVSNDIIMTCLNLRSPNQVLEDYQSVM